MKKIIYTRSDGGMTVVHPNEGARLAKSVKLQDGREFNTDTPRPIDTFLRTWPVAGAVAEWAETEDEFASRIMVKDVPADAINVRFVEASAIPADRTFRDAWEDAGVVGVNMPKAREIHKNRLRILRKPLLEALDGAYLRADEQGDISLKAQISVKKQALRDVTADPAIVAAVTPEDLKAVLPAALK